MVEVEEDVVEQEVEVAEDEPEDQDSSASFFRICFAHPSGLLEHFYLTIGFRRRRSAAEGCFLESLKCRLDTLEILLMDIQWLHVDQPIVASGIWRRVRYGTCRCKVANRFAEGSSRGSAVGIVCLQIFLHVRP